MAHKTRIGGTAYAVTGGKTVVNGTVYNMAKGRTWIGGTGYDIAFVHYVTITITGNGSAGTNLAGSVTIDGIKYTSAAVLQVPVGTEIVCAAGNGITRNGTTVSSPYTFQAEQDVNIQLIVQSVNGPRLSSVMITG